MPNVELVYVKEMDDGRRKIPKKEHEKIRGEYATGTTSQRKLARKYNVSRKLIQYILNPEMQARDKERFKERQADGRYYDTDKHRAGMRKYRQKKRDAGLLQSQNLPQRFCPWCKTEVTGIGTRKFCNSKCSGDYYNKYKR